MRRLFGLTLALTGMLALAGGITAAGASTKFAYTEEVTQNGGAIVQFEEGSLKRFMSLDYQLDATQVATLGSHCEPGPLGAIAAEVSATLTLIPDEKGRVSGTLTLALDPPQLIPCQIVPRVEYTNVTLTNLTTGHAYRLDPFSRDLPLPAPPSAESAG
jgi:hypothetical protein